MWLACSNRCGSNLFRAAFAEVDVDASGNYQAYTVVQPGYVCLNCGAPALDLGQVPAEIAADREDESATEYVEVLCPVCESLVAVGPEMECPNCSAPLEALQ